jgi:Toxin SymE, type I toxin-antitoxin system
MATSESTTQSTSEKFESRCLTVSDCPGSARGAAIRVMGRWVEKAGFIIGAKVNVEVSRGRLVIEIAPPDPDRNLSAPQRPYISERMTMIYDAAASEGVTRADAGVRVS